jgi:hypothetical protein
VTFTQGKSVYFSQELPMLTPAIEQQLHTWLCEGYPSSDILAQAKCNWPAVSEAEILNALQSNPTTAISLLQTLQQKRLRELERLEARLDDDKCPLSVHTLYRGLLRDAEAHCLKLITLDQSPKPKAPLQPLVTTPPKQTPNTPSSISTKHITKVACLFAFLLAWLIGGASTARGCSYSLHILQPAAPLHWESTNQAVSTDGLKPVAQPAIVQPCFTRNTPLCPPSTS